MASRAGRTQRAGGWGKGRGMVARVPRLAPRWQREVDAQRGWRDFQRADFLRLRAEFGVDWVFWPRLAWRIAVPLPEFAGDGLPGGVVGRVEL